MWPSIQDVKPVGDIEAAVIDILTSSGMVTALIPADNISTDQVGYTQGMKWVQVSREGGPGRPPLDFPRVDLSAFADRRSVAHDIGAAAEAVVMGSPGYQGHGLIILATQEEVGLVRSTDKEDPTPRYFCSIRLTTRATSVDS
jgi:hypothetical protein